MKIYSCPRVFLDTATTIQDKIAKIDLIMDALLDSAIDAAGTAGTDEYMLDDGQSKIRQIYRNVTDIKKAYTEFEQIRIMLALRINKRVSVLKDLNSNIIC